MLITVYKKEPTVVGSFPIIPCPWWGLSVCGYTVPVTVSTVTPGVVVIAPVTGSWV